MSLNRGLHSRPSGSTAGRWTKRKQMWKIFAQPYISEDLQFIITSLLQLLIGIGAWFVAISIQRGTIEKQNEELRTKLYENRFTIYIAFKDFINECIVQEMPRGEAFDTFRENTKRIDFLFGKEIIQYKKEVIANAVAIIGKKTNAPYQIPFIAGSIVGYFPGSTIITDLHELHKWFIKQREKELELYFKPYLDFSRAGVNVNEITMKPNVLPEPPIVIRPGKRRERKSK